MAKKKMTRLQQKAMFAKKNKHRKAWDYGDNPNIRHSHGEHKKKSKSEWWETKE